MESEMEAGVCRDVYRTRIFILGRQDTPIYNKVVMSYRLCR